jgi:SAM-dependent methyltransferase
MHSKQQAFSEWLTSEQGQSLLAVELNLLAPLFDKLYGNQALFLGVAGQEGLVQKIPMVHKFWLMDNPVKIEGVETIQAKSTAVPILPESMDLVVVSHMLEFTKSPHQVIREIDTCVKPGGHVLVIGFNPLSAWGVRKIFSKKANFLGEFCSPKRVEDWFKLLNFDIVEKSYSQHLSILTNEVTEKIGKPLNFIRDLFKDNLSGLTGIYAILAKKNILCVTPKRVTWEQEEEIIVNDLTPITAPARNICEQDN